MEDADLDIGLVRAETGRREVEQREVVLSREVLDLVGDRSEATVARMLGAGKSSKSARELAQEAVGVHRSTGGW